MENLGDEQADQQLADIRPLGRADGTRRHPSRRSQFWRIWSSVGIAG